MLHELGDDRFGLQVIISVVVVALVTHGAVEALYDAVRFRVAPFGFDINQIVRLDDRRDVAIDEFTAMIVHNSRFSVAYGYLKFYFDGVQTASPTFYWNYYDPASPPTPGPVNGSSAMSVMDQRHMALILGTGTDQPMTVHSVSVWQASSADNLTQ